MTRETYAMSDADLSTVQTEDPAESAWEAQSGQSIKWKIVAKARGGRSAELTLMQEPPPWTKQALGEMIELLELPGGWNSYSACSVSEETIGRAVNLLFNVSDQMTPRPAIVPTSSGGAQIEWHADHDIEIEVRPDGTVGFLFDENERDFKNWQLATDVVRAEIRRAFR